MGALSIPAFTPFPTDCLPELTAGYIHKAAKGIGCDETFIALPLLSSLASAIGNTRVLELKDGWQEPCIVWTMLIGESGSHKTPALKRALKTINQRQKIEFERFEQALQCYEGELEDHEAKLKEWKKSKHSERPVKPDLPQVNTLLCHDVTVEALIARLAENNRGLLVACDELSGWLASFDAYKAGSSSDAARWLEMHTGGFVRVDRKTGDKTLLHVPRASVSVTGGIQPPVLTKSLGDKHFDNGMAARFLVAMPPRRPKRWIDEGISDRDQAVIDEIFERLWALSFDDDNEPIACNFDPEAKRVYQQFYNKHGAEQARLSGNLSAAWSKLEAYSARFALLIHLLRQVEYGSLSPQAITTVDVESVQAAIRLVEWFGNETKRVYHELKHAVDESQVQATLELIYEFGGLITTREVMRNGPCIKPIAKVMRVFKELEDLGHGQVISSHPSINGGRRSIIFQLADGTDGNTGNGAAA
jgi:hypothetical protein